MKTTEKRGQAIDIEQIDLEKMREKAADLPGLLEYAHHIGGVAITPTKEGVIKGQAFRAMEEQTKMQLDLIFEQMKNLAKQVKDIQNRHQVSLEIYQAELKFTPLIGMSYYLYVKDEDKKCISMISPEEWGDQSPYAKFLAKIQLLADHTWKIEEGDIL